MFPWLKNNRLFYLAQTGRLPHMFIVIVLGVAIVFFSQLGGIPVYIAQMFLYGFSETGIHQPETMSATLSGLWMAAVLISSFSGIFLLLWLWVRFAEKRPFSSLGFERKNALLTYLRGFVLGLLMFSAAIVLLAMLGFVQIDRSIDPSMVGLSALGGVLIILLGWLVQGAAEEALTRGWMLPVLAARYHPWVGIIISSLFFAVLHGLNPNLSPIALVNLTLFGFFAAFYAMREGSLWGICALHSSWNWIQGNIFGFEVSGGSMGGGSLFKLMETGPDWMTGGLFGPEGGLAVTFILVIGIILIFAWPFKVDEESTPTIQQD
ncbi:MAG: CPBP family intramembrane glutamic endopeptidase [Anaerolineales bacterium]